MSFRLISPAWSRWTGSPAQGKLSTIAGRGPKVMRNGVDVVDGGRRQIAGLLVVEDVRIHLLQRVKLNL